ncbi:hypothetical protein J6590_041102 [Homalodisca vitripennis]|nr:hypothetical protein J6590_041102 [Homalodisca vitripennis]
MSCRTQFDIGHYYCRVPACRPLPRSVWNVSRHQGVYDAIRPFIRAPDIISVVSSSFELHGVLSRSDVDRGSAQCRLTTLRVGLGHTLSLICSSRTEPAPSARLAARSMTTSLD